MRDSLWLSCLEFPCLKKGGPQYQPQPARSAWSVNYLASVLQMSVSSASWLSIVSWYPDLDLSFLFCPFWDFPDFSGDFPDLLGDGPGFSRFVPFLFLNSPERVRDTIWTSPEKSGKPPGLETPRFCFSQLLIHRVLQGAPPRGRQLYLTFPRALDPFCKASKAPFLTLRVATPSGAPRQAPLD